jgi:pyridoxine 5-phosphate synthase
MHEVRLGLNIDHIATIRNARGGTHPDPLRAALVAQEAGADGITVHLREDRRHIRDADVYAINEQVSLPLNFEMAATNEMQRIALNIKPHSCCIVPERREELTTEGGLDVAGNLARLTEFNKPLNEAGIIISLFIDADESQVRAAKESGAGMIEIHTGKYCHTQGQERAAELQKIANAAKLAASLGLKVAAGHGLDYETAAEIVAIPEIEELNIGHFLIGESTFYGLPAVITKMKNAIKRIA